eukprot:bmy_16447T0
MRKLLPLCCWHSWLLLFYCDFQVHGADTRSQAHPGFDVLASASHYWPLESVDGIHELQETSGDIVEGKVNKGIYLKEEKGVTFLYYGRYHLLLWAVADVKAKFGCRMRAKCHIRL